MEQETTFRVCICDSETLVSAKGKREAAYLAVSNLEYPYATKVTVADFDGNNVQNFYDVDTRPY